MLSGPTSAHAAARWPVLVTRWLLGIRIYFHGIRGRLINPTDYVIKTKVHHFNTYISTHVSSSYG